MKKHKGKDIAIASDHAAFDLKKHLIAFLLKQGHSVIDMGPRSGKKPANYPEYGHKVARAVDKGEVPLGILLCGTGIGMSITANRCGSDARPHGKLAFTGQSQIVAPGGQVLDRAAADRVTLSVLEVDTHLAAEKRITARNHLLRDRRPELYGEICGRP